MSNEEEGTTFYGVGKDGVTPYKIGDVVNIPLPPRWVLEDLKKYKILVKSRMFKVMVELSQLMEMCDNFSHLDEAANYENTSKVLKKIFYIINELPKVLGDED